MINWIIQRWYRYKTKDYTKIPLFLVVFNHKDYMQGIDKNCYLYMHPLVEDDDEFKALTKDLSDYIRDNYDMTMFTRAMPDV